MAGMLRILAALMFWTLASAGAMAGERAIVVLDASGSMWAQVDGKTRIEIARETVRTVLGKTPADLELGLVAYGHREKGSCADIEEVVAAGPGNGAEIASAVERLTPKGKTPLTAAVRFAAEKLRFTEEKATVILVTDGIETCEADPCAVAGELERMGVDLTAHVVGFGLTEEEGRKVACLAENTGGLYIQAKDASALTEALTKTVAQAGNNAGAPAPQPAAPAFNVRLAALLAEGVPSEFADTYWELEGPGGQKIDRFGAALELSLPAGEWKGFVRSGLVQRDLALAITEGQTVERPVILDAGVIELTVHATADGPALDDASWEAAAGGRGASGFGRVTLVVPTGETQLTGRGGNAAASQRVVVAAGERKPVRLIAAAGSVLVTTLIAAQGPEVRDGQLYVELLSADIGAGRNLVASGFGPDARLSAPAGEYVVRAKLGDAVAEQPVSIRAGVEAAAQIVLDAGTLHVVAPGAVAVDIFSTEASGGRRRLTGAFGSDVVFTLSAGDYEVEAIYDGTRPRASTAATVIAAQRSEAQVR